ncbi:MAG: YHYH protein [Bacteroidota bacterium]
MKIVPIMGILCLVLSCSSTDDNPMTTNNEENSDNTALNCTEATSVFSIDLDPTRCTVNIQTQLGINTIYSESVSGNTRSININGVPNHLVGQFPNGGNPNAIAVVSESYSMTTNPEMVAETTNGGGYTTGVLFSGVVIEPYTAEYFEGSNGSINRSWNITALQSTTPLGLDCNNAHVQPTGRYHYHGTPSNYVDLLNIDGSEMVKVGYAADGFPLYYKYGFAADGITIVALESGYQLKSEPRGGDGVSAPDGCPDGYYFQDYEYLSDNTTLDACNGRFGKTPEADEAYYYVITDNFPSMPLCFSGTPDASFSFRP